MEERVQKIMAQANVASRRQSEKIIEQGRVRVNGTVITIGDKADPQKDTIEVDGQPINVVTKKTYIALHKPINVLSTNKAHKKDDRPTVRDILPFDEHLFMIGRLDAESTGLLVLTNDGDMKNRLTHPRYRHTKTYQVTVHGIPPQDIIEQWENGVFLEDGKTAPCLVRVKKTGGGLTTLEIVMTEGKNRQIRRVASELGYPVHNLTRTHIGQFSLGSLKSGEYMEMTDKDIQLLQSPSPDRKLISRKKRQGRRYKKR